MQFLVPQFIDTEDKIFGPISTRQFVEILAGFGLIYVAYKLSTLWLFLVEAIIILGLVIVFAFVKINGQPFHFFILNLITTLRRPKVKIWKKVIGDSAILGKKKKEQIKESKVYKKRPVSHSRLTELSLVVDTGGSYQAEEDNEPQLQVKKKNKQKING